MRVLITGASGMLGLTLSSFLIAQGHTVIRHGHESVADVVCDLTDRAETACMLRKIEPDSVINLVGATNVDECERSPRIAYLLNAKTVENLVSGLIGIKKAFLIQVSTDQVYDSEGDSDEYDVRLTNAYAMSKYEGELLALQMPAAVLRTNFFGSSQHPTRKSFSDWLIKNFRNGKVFTAFTDVAFTPLLMDTLSKAINRVLCQPAIGVFNLGSRQGMTKAEFAVELATTFDFPYATMQLGSVADAKLVAYRPKNMCMDCSKFEHTFGMKLPLLRDEIKRMRDEINVAT